MIHSPHFAPGKKSQSFLVVASVRTVRDVMRAKLIAAAVALMIGAMTWAAEAQLGGPRFPSTAEAESILRGWAKDNLASNRVLPFEVSNRKLLVLIGDIGSGVSVSAIAVYSLQSRHWTLAAIRYAAANSQSVTVTTRRDSLVVFSKTGRQLMVLPVEGFFPFDAKEQ